MAGMRALRHGSPELALFWALSWGGFGAVLRWRNKNPRSA
jgi:CHASE2 domain-containing sensor protein